MHSSPGIISKFLFVKQNRIRLYAFGSVSTVLLMAGNWMFVQAHPAFWAYGLVALLTGIYLVMTYAVGFIGRDFDHQKHRRLVARWLDRCEEASVDIYLPICGEPRGMILNTWEDVSRMKRSHPFVRVYVLDDKPSNEMMLAAESFGFKYITRESNELKKAGNLRNAFKQTSGEFIVIFDADFCPRTDFLIETLPYFFEDQDVAVVQTPQFFDHNGSNNWLMNAAGSVQELFYRLIQVNRDRFGGAVCVGTNAVYRRDALAPFGGTAPMPYSEDVHTGFQLISSGWKLKYIPVILAEGVCPDKIQSFFTQQYRWAMGSISLFFSRKFWKAGITSWQRLCYLTGMLFYITTGLGVVLAPIPTIAMLWLFPQHVHWYNLLFAVPSLIFGTLFMSYWMRLPFSLDVLRVRQISYFAHLFALIDYITGRVEEWKPTGGSVSSRRYAVFRPVAKIIWALSSGSVAALILWRLQTGTNPVDLILVGAFCVFNSVVLLPLIEKV